jgi:hypothetical protein
MLVFYLLKLYCKHTFIRTHPLHHTTAAACGRLELLRWLLRHNCPISEELTLLCAARSGSVSMLKWLATVTPHWSSQTKQSMLTRCGWWSNKVRYMHTM